MLSFLLLSITLFSFTNAEILFYAAENGTRPWLTYTNVSVSFGFDNYSRLWTEDTVSHLDLNIMVCSDQYDTGNETCCVVGIQSVFDSRDMDITT